MADEEVEVVEQPVTAAVPVVEEAPLAAPATTPAPASPSFDSLVVKPEEMAALQAKLVGIKKNQMAGSGAIADETIGRLRQDRTRMEEAYKATALPADVLQPWDQKAKQNEYRTDPVEAFGSIGSIFAMLAPAFVGLPMEASLNAGAAAINAIHTQDDKAYDRDQKSWKENNDLALKRHEIMRQSYNDATNLMNSNLNAGRTQLELSARKYGDQQALALLESGMDKELTDLFVSRNKAAQELASTADKVWLDHEKVSDLKNDPRYSIPALKPKAIEEWQTRWRPGGAAAVRYDAEKDFVDTYKRENPNWTSDSVSDAVAGFREKMAKAEASAEPAKTTSAPAAKVAEINRRKQEYISAGMSETEAYDKAAKEVAAATAPPPKTSESSQALKVRGIKEIQDENPGMSVAEATKLYNQRTTTVTGNRADDISQMINQYDNGMKGIDKAMGVLNKYVGAAGAAGYVTRLGERVGNIFGSNQTDRSQFAHEIEYLQAIAPRLLQGTGGRPLSAEASKINRLIAGLNLGDTTANTKRALEEVKDLWGKMQQDALARRGNTPNLPPATGSAPGTSKPKWMQAPIVTPAGPRADLGDDSMVA